MFQVIMFRHGGLELLNQLSKERAHTINVTKLMHVGFQVDNAFRTITLHFARIVDRFGSSFMSLNHEQINNLAG